MTQASEELKVSSMVVRRLIAQKLLPARQVVKYAPWVIERKDLDLPVVRKVIWMVHEGLRGSTVPEDQALLFVDV